MQTDILGLDGRFLGRGDFYWDEFRVVGEVDGRTKYADEDPVDAFYREKRRQERMEDAGLVFARWGKFEVDHPQALLAKIESAFARAARRPASERLWVARPSVRSLAPPR